MQWTDLLRTAETLAQLPSASQSDLNRAVSTAYYAAFHALCRTCADCVAGTDGLSSSNEAWQQAYCALEHRLACRQCGNISVMQSRSPEIRIFARQFVMLQDIRQRADHDPSFDADQKRANEIVKFAKAAIDSLNSAPEKDRHAFAIWVSHRHRA